MDTIISKGEEVLAYHSSRRTSNGSFEGINNLPQPYDKSLTGSPNYANYAARGIPPNMSSTPTPNTTTSRSLYLSLT